jgi:hypothetical protein
MRQPNDGSTRSRMRTVGRQTPQLCTRKVGPNEAPSLSLTFGKHELHHCITQSPSARRRAAISLCAIQARSECNSRGRSHRTAWADSRRPRLEVRGREYRRSDRPLSVRWESLCPIETSCCADRGHPSWACRSRQPGSRCGRVRVSARTLPPTKMPGRPTLSNASRLRWRFQPLGRHRRWQLLVRYLALGKTGNRETAFTEQRMSSATLRPNLGATARCFDYTSV